MKGQLDASSLFILYCDYNEELVSFKDPYVTFVRVKSPSGLLFSNDCSVSILVQIYIFLCFKPVIWKYHGNSSHLNNSHHDCSHDRCYYDCSHQVTMHDSSHLLLIWPKLIIIKVHNNYNNGIIRKNPRGGSSSVEPI